MITPKFKWIVYVATAGIFAVLFANAQTTATNSSDPHTQLAQIDEN